jgi:cobalt-zinc-cadmium efflux system protein
MASHPHPLPDAAPAGGHAHGDGHGHGHDHPAHAADTRHGHGHGHGHAHAVPEGGDFQQAFLIGITLNLLFVAVEAFYGWKVNSLALLADAAHNLGDVAGLGLAWGAALAGRRVPDARHTYGWKRATILAAFANAVLLLVAMGSLGWEAVRRLGEAPPADGRTLMVVAGVGIVVNGVTALLFARGRHGDMNIRGAFLHLLSDALVSAGVVLAGGLVLAFGWAWLDPVVSLAIAAVILIATWGLFRESLHLLFDGVPDRIDLAAVRAALAALPGVDSVNDLHVWAMGTSEVALTAHLVMPGGLPDDGFYRRASDELQARFQIGHATLQVMTRPVVPACDAARA